MSLMKLPGSVKSSTAAIMVVISVLLTINFTLVVPLLVTPPGQEVVAIRVENAQSPVDSLTQLSNGTIWLPRNQLIIEPTLESEMAGGPENGNLYAPDIIVDNGLYIMWYGAQSSSGHDAIHFATSEDGVHWTKHGVVIETGTNNHVNDPSVVKVNGTFYMYYTVAPVAEIDEIWLATSQDGWNWTVHGRVIGQEDSGWDSLKVGRPSVLFENGTFKMWFDGSEKDPDDPTKIRPGTGRHVGYAWSTDGFIWTKWGGNPVLLHSGAVDVERIDGKYVIVEEWQEGVLWRTGTNETTWEPTEARRILFKNSGSDFDAYGHVTPFILVDDGRWVATYTGAATWKTWNRNRIDVWYPVANVTLRVMNETGSWNPVKGWCDTRTSILFEPGPASTGNPWSMEWNGQSSILDDIQGTITTGTTTLFIDRASGSLREFQPR